MGKLSRAKLKVQEAFLEFKLPFLKELSFSEKPSFSKSEIKMCFVQTKKDAFPLFRFEQKTNLIFYWNQESNFNNF